VDLPSGQANGGCIGQIFSPIYSRFSGCCRLRNGDLQYFFSVWGTGQRLTSLFTGAFCFYESNEIFNFCQSNFAGLRVLHEIRWSLVDGLRRYVGFKYAGLTAPEG